MKHLKNWWNILAIGISFVLVKVAMFIEEELTFEDE